MTVGVMGLVLANYDGGVTPVWAQGPPGNPTVPNPLTEVINQLNTIQAALTTASGQNNHTLRWDTHNPSATRFVTAFPGAVLDKNTGLVWEQAPTNFNPNATTLVWEFARGYCANKNVGGTRGWHLPSVVELSSLIDPSLPPPYVQASAFIIGGTPGVQSAQYWSTTTFADIPSYAWNVNFGNGFVSNALKNSPSPQAWCVRGPSQESVY